MTQYQDDFDSIARQVVATVGKTIIVAAPLGIGKPIGILNALYRLAEQEPSIQLTIMTALTLARPEPTSDLEKRFATPLLDRLLGNYVDPLYEHARVHQHLPSNIHVIEFFLTTAKYLHNDYVQQHYTSSSYTLAARDSLRLGVNVYAQQVAPSPVDSQCFSLSSNSDLFLAAKEGLAALAAAGRPTAVIAEVNANLPFMQGDAIVTAADFTAIVDPKTYPALFAIPHDMLAPADHMIGLYTSFLIPDDSMLQIGIGKLSNALANALILRQQHQTVYHDLATTLSMAEKFGTLVDEVGGMHSFEKGLTASTEMLSDGYLQLYDKHILKKRVYDHVALQKLLNAGVLTETIQPDCLTVLVAHGVIASVLTAADLNFLQQFGVLQAEVTLQQGQLLLPSGESVSADIAVSAKALQPYLGKELQQGKIIHAGFFLGTNYLYERLRKLTPSEAAQINMTSIARTNTLFWSHDLLQAQRLRARFVNTTMMVTLGGAAISDGLQDMQEVSGIGGQCDFVHMAQYLDGARSILNCRSTRTSAAGVTSNIVWDYPSLTIPRFLRDIVVTEYGIADCRSKTDSDVIKAMLNIADSRFQPSLLKQAKRAGKIARDYEIPAVYRQNYPDKVHKTIRNLQAQGLCERYPFGTELTAAEQVIMDVLMRLQQASPWRRTLMVVRALLSWRRSPNDDVYLARMQLQHPKTWQEWMYRKLLRGLW